MRTLTPSLFSERRARTAVVAIALASTLGIGSTLPARAQVSGTPLIAVSMDPVVTGEKADYNGDGFDDFVAGSPGERLFVPPFVLTFTPNAGQVNVIYGSGSRLQASDDERFDLNDAGMAGDALSNDRLGDALASGDFNGDGFSDLASGMPLPNGLSPDEGGRVSILYGGGGGLDTSGSQVFSQNTPGAEDTSEVNDLFGDQLASGDFNADGRTDLAIGVPGESVAGVAGTAHGAVQILYGTAAGLSTAGDQIWTQDSAGIADAAEAGDRFGASLATGDFNGDFVSDLAIGVPFEDNPAIADEGAVHIIFGQSAVGLSSTGSRLLNRRAALVHIPSDSSAYQFGAALAAGDLNGDGFDDLAVGLPGDDIGTATDAGSVMIFHGSATGAFIRYSTEIQEDLGGVQGVAQSGDRFGAALTIGKFGGDAFEDLAIGVPGDVVGSADDAGSVHVFFSQSFGVNLGNQVVLTQSFLQSGGSEAGDRFGSALANGDFNGDGFDDLVIGVPNEDIGSHQFCGAAHAVYGTLTGLDTNTAQLWSQGTSGVEGAQFDEEFFGSAVR